MTAPTPTVVAGIDIGKSGLDAHIDPSGQARHCDNTRTGRRALRNWLLKHHVTRVVLEPTGRYHRELHQCLSAARIDTIVVNPLRSRRFAEAVGKLAKNDRVDAAMLARYGHLGDLQPTLPKPANLLELNDLIALRRKLVEQRGALRKLRAEFAVRFRIAAAAGLARRAAIVCSVVVYK